LGLVEVFVNHLGGFAGHYRSQRLSRCLPHIAKAAEVGEQALSRLRANAGNIQQLGIAIAHSSALAMIANGKAVAFIADELHQVQDR
jgi:hypothetical protein